MAAQFWPAIQGKVDDICGLYLNPSPNDVVLCVDEKTGMQALGRKHPFRNAAPVRDARMDYEYVRNETRKLIAAFDPYIGDVYGEIRKNWTGEHLNDFMEAVAHLYTDQDIHCILG